MCVTLIKKCVLRAYTKKQKHQHTQKRKQREAPAAEKPVPGVNNSVGILHF